MANQRHLFTFENTNQFRDSFFVKGKIAGVREIFSVEILRY